jgi:hypothetical protein
LIPKYAFFLYQVEYKEAAMQTSNAMSELLDIFMSNNFDNIELTIVAATKNSSKKLIKQVGNKK